MAEPWIDTEVLTAAQLAGMPWGVMAYAQGSTANQTGITAITDITGLSVSFTAVSTRLYRTTLFVQLTQNGSASTPSVLITDAAGTQKAGVSVSLGVGEAGEAIVLLLETGLSGAITRKGRATVGAGTLTIVGAANLFGHIIVEDLGPG